MALQDLIDEEHYLQALLDKLLCRDKEQEMDFQLHGYSANWLDTPGYVKGFKQSASASRLKAMLGKLALSFPIMEEKDGQIKSFDQLTFNERTTLFEFGMKKATIPTKKLKSLLCSNGINGKLVSNKAGHQFHIIVPFKTLLPYVEVEQK